MRVQSDDGWIGLGYIELIVLLGIVFAVAWIVATNRQKAKVSARPLPQPTAQMPKPPPDPATPQQSSSAAVVEAPSAQYTALPSAPEPSPRAEPVSGAAPCSRAVVGIPATDIDDLRSRNDAFMAALAGAELREGHRLAFHGLTLEILELEPAPSARVTGTTELRIRATEQPTLACPGCGTVPEGADAFCVGCGNALPVLQLA